MAKLRGLTHRIARLLLLAFCVSLLTAVSLSLTPATAPARTSQIIQGSGDMGGALESKPDEWAAPTRLSLAIPDTAPPFGEQPLLRAILRGIFRLLAGWV